MTTAATATHLPDSIEHLPTDTLVPYARNSRTHSPEQVAQIAASIKEFGFTNPVLIDANNTLIAGHGRVMAAQSIGLPTVPAIRLAHLTDAQRRAYVIADNKLAENAGWDMATLAREVEDLQADGFNLDLLGFDDDELTALLGAYGQEKKPAGLTDPDAVPPALVEALTRTSDVWLLGRHRVMCGDSTSAADVGALMAGKRAALIHADPPYGMGKDGDGVANDNLYGDKLSAFQLQWWRAFRPFIEGSAGAYIWGNAPELWRLWWRSGLGDSERLTMRNEIVWRKSGGIQGVRSDTHRMFPTSGERCLFFVIGEQGFSTNSDNYWEGYEGIRCALASDVEKMGWGPKDIERICGVGMYSHWFTKSQWTFIPEHHYKALQAAAREHDAFKREHDEIKREFYATRAYFDNTHDAMSDVWEFSQVIGADRHGHATPKPVAMMERVMRSSLPPGGLCVEPFGGSGSTLMGAETTGRVCYTMELQGKYVDVIVRRWQAFTGKQATLESTGQTFEQVQAERLSNE